MEKKRKSGFWKTVLIIIIALFILNGISSHSSDSGFSKKDIEQYVHDNAGVLTKDTAEYICAENMSLEQQCGAQIIFVTTNSTGGVDIADQAYDYFDKYSPGESKNNGLLVLVSVNDGGYYAVQGRGIEDGFSAGTLQMMLDRCLGNCYTESSYDDGIRQMFDMSIEHYEKMYSISVSPSPNFGKPQRKGLFEMIGDLLSKLTGIAKKIIKIAVIILFIVFGLIAALMLIISMNDKKKKVGGTNGISVEQTGTSGSTAESGGKSVDTVIEVEAKPVSPNKEKENKNPYSSK